MGYPPFFASLQRKEQRNGGPADSWTSARLAAANFALKKGQNFSLIAEVCGNFPQLLVHNLVELSWVSQSVD